MTRERALEILAAFGAKPHRWPPDERAALAALVREDAAVRAALGDAEALDRAIARALAGAPPVVPRRDDAAAAEAVLRAHGPARAGGGAARRWLWPGALAAAGIAAGVALWWPTPGVVPDAPPTLAMAPSAEVAVDGAASDAELLALMFSATPDEDLL